MNGKKGAVTVTRHGMEERDLVFSGEPSTSALGLEMEAGLLTESISPASFPEPETPFDAEDSTLAIHDVDDSWLGFLPPEELDALNLASLTSPTLLAGFDTASQLASTLPILQRDVLFTIRRCSVGFLLVAFHKLQVCVLRVASTEDELLLDLFAKCGELGCGYVDFGAGEVADGLSPVDQQSKVAMLEYVDGVVESLERPLGLLGKSGSTDLGM